MDDAASWILWVIVGDGKGDEKWEWISVSDNFWCGDETVLNSWQDESQFKIWASTGW